MEVRELRARFPEVPADLAEEPLLRRFAEELDPLLRIAVKPSPCAQRHDAANHYYLKLIGPLAIYGYRLASREKTLEQLTDLLERNAAEPAAFAASLLTDDVAPSEVRGPGCD